MTETFLVWVDEIGSDHRDHARRYGYAISGCRLQFITAFSREDHECPLLHDVLSNYPK